MSAQREIHIVFGLFADFSSIDHCGCVASPSLSSLISGGPHYSITNPARRDLSLSRPLDLLLYVIGVAIGDSNLLLLIGLEERSALHLSRGQSRGARAVAPSSGNLSGAYFQTIGKPRTWTKL